MYAREAGLEAPPGVGEEVRGHARPLRFLPCCSSSAPDVSAEHSTLPPFVFGLRKLNPYPD